MRLPRLTARRLMVLVAVGAIVLESMQIRQRASEYQLKADLLGLMETVHREGLDPNFCYLAKDAIPNPKMAEYYLQMQRKYERASRFPWFPVPSNPPLPE